MLNLLSSIIDSSKERQPSASPFSRLSCYSNMINFYLENETDEVNHAKGWRAKRECK